jgi:hypothetical protein
MGASEDETAGPPIPITRSSSTDDTGGRTMLQLTTGRGTVSGLPQRHRRPILDGIGLMLLAIGAALCAYVPIAGISIIGAVVIARFSIDVIYEWRRASTVLEVARAMVAVDDTAPSTDADDTTWMGKAS